jgi:hypothetical protein
MRPIKPATGVVFIEFETEKAFNSLSEDSPLKKSLKKAISDLREIFFVVRKYPID